MNEQLHITFGGDGQMTVDEAWQNIESRKEELLEQAESGWLVDEKKPHGKGPNIREAIDLQIPDDADMAKAVGKDTVLWTKIKDRFPSVEDRDLLVRAYKENFLPKKEAELDDEFEKFDQHRNKGITIATEQAKLDELIEQVKSTKKLTKYFDFFEAAQKEVTLAKKQQEETIRFDRERQAAREKKAKDMLAQFMDKKVNIPHGDSPATPESVADIAARIGAGIEKNENNPLSEEEWQSMRSAAKKILSSVVDISPDIKDQALLEERVREEEIRALIRRDRTLALHGQHEKTESDIAEEHKLDRDYLRLHQIHLGLVYSIRPRA